MRRIATVEATRDWRCPNCGRTDTTPAATPNRQHYCPRLRGLIAPLVPVGVRARVFVREREDYIGSDHVQLDPELRRPVMSIVTERADGSNDAIVFAPVVRIGR
jgi:hypothetical protein